jgi:hypothetical protein
MGDAPNLEEQIKEVNQKLDIIMRALSIGVPPERNQRELKQLAGSIVDKIRRKEQNGYSPKKRSLGN